MSTLGNKIAKYEDEPRSVIGEVVETQSGNVSIRVGKEHYKDGPWSQTEYVTLTPDETYQLIGRLIAAVKR